jgi:putative endonuclease
VPREHRYYVYLLTNWNNKVMYVGMTNDLMRRVHEHRTHAVKGFTEKYNVHKLVYFEETSDVHAAIAREKEIKKWRREKKNALVVRTNPEWRDLGHDIGLPPLVPMEEETVIPTKGESVIPTEGGSVIPTSGRNPES